MERYLIENYGVNPEMRDYGVEWLASLGGGDIVTILKSNMKDSFDVDTEGEYKKLEKRLARKGIRLATQRGGYSPQKNVFALYPDRKLLEELEESDTIENLLVLGWTGSDFERWRDEHDVTLVDGGRPTPDWYNSI